MTIGMTTTAKNGLGKRATIITVDFGNALKELAVLANRHGNNAELKKAYGTIQFFVVFVRLARKVSKKKLKVRSQMACLLCVRTKWVSITVLSSFPSPVQSCTGFTPMTLTVAQR